MFKRRAVEPFGLSIFIQSTIKLQNRFGSRLEPHTFYVYITCVGVAGYKTGFLIKINHSAEVGECPMPRDIRLLQALHFVQLPYN